MVNFKKISLNSGGLKGAELHYTEPNERGVMELTKKFPRNPIHLGLQKNFKDLRVHLLSICGLINSEMDNNIAAQHLVETTVDCIEIDGNTIVLSGEKLATVDKSIKLKTYKLEEEDGYEFYPVVRELVDTICAETFEYMNGNKKVSEAEIVSMWAAAKHKEEEFTMEKLLELPADQLKKMALTVIEKGLGGMVMLPEDIEQDDAAVLESVEELKTEFEVGEETVIDVPVAEKPKKEKKEKKQEVETTSDETEF